MSYSKYHLICDGHVSSPRLVHTFEDHTDEFAIKYVETRLIYIASKDYFRFTLWEELFLEPEHVYIASWETSHSVAIKRIGQR